MAVLSKLKELAAKLAERIKEKAEYEAEFTKYCRTRALEAAKRAYEEELKRCKLEFEKIWKEKK